MTALGGELAVGGAALLVVAGIIASKVSGDPAYQRAAHRALDGAIKGVKSIATSIPSAVARILNPEGGLGGARGGGPTNPAYYPIGQGGISLGGGIATGGNPAVNPILVVGGGMTTVGAIATIDIAGKWTGSVSEIADALDATERDVRTAIHAIKRAPGFDGNPNVEVNTETGDVRIEGSDDVIDNIRDYLPS